jgi:hypothetical protein
MSAISLAQTMNTKSWKGWRRNCTGQRRFETREIMSTRDICFWWLVCGCLIALSVTGVYDFCTGRLWEPIAWIWWGEVLTYSALGLVGLIGMGKLIKQRLQTHELFRVESMKHRVLAVLLVLLGSGL